MTYITLLLLLFAFTSCNKTSLLSQLLYRSAGTGKRDGYIFMSKTHRSWYRIRMTQTTVLRFDTVIIIEMPHFTVTAHYHKILLRCILFAAMQIMRTTTDRD